MKKFAQASIAAALLASSMSSCKDNAKSKENAKPSALEQPQTHFEKVTSHLDHEGDFFEYTKINDQNANVNGIAELVEKIILLEKNIRDKDKQAVLDGVKVAKTLMQESGVLEFDAIGMSAVKKDGYYHNKSIMHTKSTNGTLFKVLGGKSHDLTSQQFLPQNTVFAVSGDLKLVELWNTLEKVSQTSTNPQIKMIPDMLKKEMAKGKIDLTKLLNEQTGEIGVFFTADSKKQITMPGRGPKVILPQLDATLFIARKGQILDDLISKGLPKNLKTEQVDGFTITTLPALPNPMQTQAAIATSKDYIFISSNIERLKESILNVKLNKGLTSTEKFKKLSKDIPTQGNSYIYLDPQTAKTFLDVVSKAVPAKDRDAVEYYTNQIPNNFFYYGVSQVTADGLMNTNNFTMRQDVVQGSMLMTAGATGVIAAMIVPALSKARAKAMRNK